MRKISIIFMLVFTALSIYCAENNNIIEEIVVRGLTRSDEDLVIRQLPFSIGDEWKDEYETEVEERLFRTFVFDVTTIDVSTEKMETDGVKVIIDINDSNMFMIHPIFFGIQKISDLTNSELNQTLINPLGNGLSIYAGFSWKNKSFSNSYSGPWWKSGVKYLGSKGRYYTYEHKEYEENKDFNDIKYVNEGIDEKVTIEFPINLETMLNFDIIDSDFTTEINNEKLDNEYLILKNSIDYTDKRDLKLEFTYIADEKDFNTNYSKVSFLWNEVLEFNKNKLVNSVKAGYSSKDTPLYFQFNAGGYSNVPLRGHEFNLAGTEFLTGNTEYHRNIFVNNLWVIGFFDYGKIVKESREFSETDWITDGGLAISYDTPIGALRFDYGKNLQGDGFTWNINVGHTY